MKSCSKCGEAKPLSEYHKKKQSKDGHHPTCKVCRKAASQHDCVASGCDHLVKVCTECGETKPVLDFSLGTENKGGHSPRCNRCRSAHYVTRYESLPDHVCGTACDQIEKVCEVCNELRPLVEFPARKDSSDGHRGKCEGCSSEYGRSYYEENREEIRASQNEKYATDPEWRARVLASNRAWVDSNPEKVRETKKAYYEANLDKFREYRKNHYYSRREEAIAATRKWYEENRDEALARRRDRRTDRYANDPVYRAKVIASNLLRNRLQPGAKQEPYTREEIFDRDGWICGLCEEPVDPELSHPDPYSVSVDHIIPLSLGGDDTPANVQAAHLRCNLSKNNRVELEDQTMLTGVAG